MCGPPSKKKERNNSDSAETLCHKKITDVVSIPVFPEDPEAVENTKSLRLYTSTLAHFAGKCNTGYSGKERQKFCYNSSSSLLKLSSFIKNGSLGMGRGIYKMFNSGVFCCA